MQDEGGYPAERRDAGDDRIGRGRILGWGWIGAGFVWALAGHHNLM
jgi:hypothetical protein